MGYDKDKGYRPEIMRLRPLLKNDSRVVKDQRGAASIYVSFIIMIILSLLALTFAQIMSDRYLEIAESQFDLQAHYAAESAINTVRATIHKSLRDREQVSNAAVDITVEPATTPSLSTKCGISAPSKYGAALDVSSSGNVLAVGAPGSNIVCLLEKDSSDSDWSSTTTVTEELVQVDSMAHNDLKPDNTNTFGFSVAFSSKERLLAIGAPGDRGGRGSVYIFEKTGGSWNMTTKLVPCLPISSPENASTPGLQDLSLSASSCSSTDFGRALEWHDGGFLIGAPGNDAVYHLSNSSGDWTSKDYITGSSGFGLIIVSDSVRLAKKDDGSANLAISDRSGRIYLFKDDVRVDPFCHAITGNTTLGQGTCFHQGPITRRVSDFSLSGGVLAIGYAYDVTNKGEVDVLEREGPSWTEKYRILETGTVSLGSGSGWKKLEVAGASAIGQAVTMIQTQNNNRLLIIGDPNEDKIHFFTVESNDILNDIWASDA